MGKRLYPSFRNGETEAQLIMSLSQVITVTNTVNSREQGLRLDIQWGQAPNACQFASYLAAPQVGSTGIWPH